MDFVFKLVIHITCVDCEKSLDGYFIYDYVNIIFLEMLVLQLCCFWLNGSITFWFEGRFSCLLIAVLKITKSECLLVKWLQFIFRKILTVFLSRYRVAQWLHLFFDIHQFFFLLEYFGEISYKIIKSLIILLSKIPIRSV